MPDASAGQTLAPVVPLAKAEGAFLALAAGDALGWPQEMRRSVRSNASGTSSPRIEFQTWVRRTGGRYRPYEETIGAGEYSDDTQLTLAVARSRTNHGADWWKAFMRVELPRWTIYERGGGGATKRAAQAWLAGVPPWQSGKIDAVRRYFDAGGNGVAMRVLPHALFLAAQDDPAVLVHDVVRDGAATHGHPRALVGATACAYAAWSLARRNRTLGFGELLDLLIDEQDRGWGAFPDMERGGEAWSRRRSSRARRTLRASLAAHRRRNAATCWSRPVMESKRAPWPTTARCSTTSDASDASRGRAPSPLLLRRISRRDMRRSRPRAYSGRPSSAVPTRTRSRR